MIAACRIRPDPNRDPGPVLLDLFKRRALIQTWKAPDLGVYFYFNGNMQIRWLVSLWHQLYTQRTHCNYTKQLNDLMSSDLLRFWEVPIVHLWCASSDGNNSKVSRSEWKIIILNKHSRLPPNFWIRLTTKVKSKIECKLLVDCLLKIIILHKTKTLKWQHWLYSGHWLQGAVKYAITIAFPPTIAIAIDTGPPPQINLRSLSGQN